MTAQRHAIRVQRQCWSLAPVANTAMRAVCGFDSWVIGHSLVNMETFLGNRGLGPTCVRSEHWVVESFG